MAAESIILVVNPGSASRKYALFADGVKRADILFEFVNGKVVGKIEFDGQKFTKDYDDENLSTVSKYILPLIREHNVIDDAEKISAIGIRVVAPSKKFMSDEIVTEEVKTALEAVQKRAPLHVGTALAEIKQLSNFITDTPIIIISDSAFHATKPQWAWHYGIDTELAEKLDIKRFGYHGISVGSVVYHMNEHDMVSPKMIICHLGSGSSISAVQDGKSVETTMGYTPLEGLMMLTRCGEIDVPVAMAIKRELQLTDDELEEYLNKKCGIAGVSGGICDVRELLQADADGNEKAQLALKMFVYRIQLAIGKMAASMNGVDAIVFTATIGERSAPVRQRILDGLNYLGFVYDKETNDNVFEPKVATNIGTAESKPIWVISTDESSEIARRAAEYIKK